MTVMSGEILLSPHILIVSYDQNFQKEKEKEIKKTKKRTFLKKQKGRKNSFGAGSSS